MQIIHPGKAKGQKIVVIIGGGFAGLNAAKTLADQPEVEVILIDKRNHHLFQPLLYQVATAGLNPSDIAAPIRAQFSKNKNIEVHLGKINKINLNKKYVGEDDLQLHYDYLILACGARHSYFGKNEWEDFAPGLKTLEQATEIRKRILSSFEMAENEIDPEKRAAFLNFVVVGGGPTGVELAGAIADISKTVLVNDFKHIDASSAKVILVEGSPRILASFDPKLSEKAAKDLKDLGVDVRQNTRVMNITQDGVQAGEEFIHSRCVIWAAGVQATQLEFDEPVEKDRAGRIKVNAWLNIQNHPEVFVVGDMANMPWKNGEAVPGLAPAAIQSGEFVAKNILQNIRGKSPSTFQYVDKGSMATVGRNRAVLQVKQFRMSGLLAWLGWLFIHILYLIGFKNRMTVLAQWTWSYVFSKRGSRLITEKTWKIED